jgi:hypothetical protein
MLFADQSRSSVPLPVPRQRNGAPGWPAWIAPCVSVCCFVHCIGMAVFLSLLPSTFAFLARTEQYEWALWIVSAVFVSLSLWMQRAHLTGWLVRSWGAAVVAGIVALTCTRDFARPLSLAGLAGVQLWLVSRRWRLHQEIGLASGAKPDCCTRED